MWVVSLVLEDWGIGERAVGSSPASHPRSTSDRLRKGRRPLARMSQALRQCPDAHSSRGASDTISRRDLNFISQVPGTRACRASPCHSPCVRYAHDRVGSCSCGLDGCRRVRRTAFGAQLGTEMRAFRSGPFRDHGVLLSKSGASVVPRDEHAVTSRAYLCRDDALRLCARSLSPSGPRAMTATSSTRPLTSTLPTLLRQCCCSARRGRPRLVGHAVVRSTGRVVLKQRLPRTWRMAAVELDVARAESTRRDHRASQRRPSLQRQLARPSVGERMGGGAEDRRSAGRVLRAARSHPAARSIARPACGAELERPSPATRFALGAVDGDAVRFRRASLARQRRAPGSRLRRYGRASPFRTSR